MKTMMNIDKLTQWQT